MNKWRATNLVLSMNASCFSKRWKFLTSIPGKFSNPVTQVFPMWIEVQKNGLLGEQLFKYRTSLQRQAEKPHSNAKCRNIALSKSLRQLHSASSKNISAIPWGSYAVVRNYEDDGAKYPARTFLYFEFANLLLAELYKHLRTIPERQ